ncbi:hypothetical protein WJ972_15265 [Achromobacter insuavis]
MDAAVVEVAAPHHFGHVEEGAAAGAALPVPGDQFALEQIAAVVAARADGDDGLVRMEGDVVDGQARRVAGRERHGIAAAVEADAMAQRGAAIGGARGRIDQEGKGGGHGDDVAGRVEEHAGDPAGAPQRRIHERVHD